MPSPATDQSPALEPLIAVCTSLPSRGPAARALTVSRCSTAYAVASGSSIPTSRTALTLSSSATISARSRPARPRPATTTSARPGEAACAARRPCAAPSPPSRRRAPRPFAATRRGVGRQVAAPGQSVRCTDRLAGQPPPDLLGDQRQQRRRHPATPPPARCTGCRRRRCRQLVAGPQKRSRERRMYQFVSTSRKPPSRRRRRRSRRRRARASISSTYVPQLGQDVAVHQVGGVGAPPRV